VRRIALALALAAAGCMPPAWGAGALLHPGRTRVSVVPALPHRDFAVEGDGVVLRGWDFPARPPARGPPVVYLHGIGDNRASGLWIAERLVAEGHEVVVYDGRAHGDSTGDACTYGVRERRDLSRVLDALGIRRAVLVGVSLGAAVALQAAADDPRVVGVVSSATFSDLETVARERAPFLASEAQIREAFAIASAQGGFSVADASPLRAAPRIHVPVLLVHGTGDRKTSPAHSRRVFDALGDPRRLLLVQGAGHDDALGKAWPEVEEWIGHL
jgi:pimeloyl-ACP methyl ester carboxylesterase